MTHATHTQGPWTVSQPSGIYIDAPTGCIAALNYGALEGDARLIAAAPDLLAASEAFISELDSGSDFTAWEKAKDNLREAIAKAKGA